MPKRGQRAIKDVGRDFGILEEVRIEELFERLGNKDNERAWLPMLRPEDLLVLEVAWEGLDIRVDEDADGNRQAFLELTNQRSDGLLLVRFPPQHIEEDAFFETAPGFEVKPAQPAPAETATIPDVVDARIAARSLLAFVVPAGSAPLLFGTAEMLDAITRLPLKVHPGAKPRQPQERWDGRVDVEKWFKHFKGLGEAPAFTSPRRAAPLTRRVIVNLGAIGRHVPIEHAVAAQARLQRFGIVEGLMEAEEIVTGVRREPVKVIGGRSRAGMRRPTDTETAIEMPYKLVLSPNASAAFTHRARPEAAGPSNRVELWHSRLGTRVSDGGVDERTPDLRTVRAVWARSGAPIGFPLRPGEPTQKQDQATVDDKSPYTSLDMRDRWSIAHLTADFDDPDYTPDPVDVHRLMLTSLGGWLDSHGTWSGYDGISLSEWRHVATLGRDHYVRVVYEGRLFPFGHRAALVKVTERKFQAKMKGNPAVLRQRMFIVVREPVRSYAPGDASDDQGRFYERSWPFLSLRMRPQVTPWLDPPGSTQIREGDGQMFFWPFVGKAPFRFLFTGQTLEGDHVEFGSPVIFAANEGTTVILPEDPAATKKARNAWEAPAWKAPGPKAPTIDLEGQSMALAAPGKIGDTTFVVEQLEISAHIPGATAWGKLAEPDGTTHPRFYPTVKSARVRMPVAEQMVGRRDSIKVTFNDTFLKESSDGGFGAATNKGQLFLDVADKLDMDFSAQGDKSGGLMQPSFTVSGVSRLLGPVAGDIGSAGKIVNGQFDPQEFFSGGLGPKLFGVLDLADLVEEVSALADIDAVPKFVTEMTATFQTLLSAATTLQQQAKALKASAEAATTMATTAKAQLEQRAQDLADHAEAVVTLIGQLVAGPSTDPLEKQFLDAMKALVQDLQGLAVDLRALPAEIPADVREPLASTVDRVASMIGTDAKDYADTFLDVLRLRGEMTIRFDWSPRLQDASVFKAKRKTSDAALVVSVELQNKSLARPVPTVDISARLTDFTLLLVDGIANFLELEFERLEFVMETGRKPDINVEFGDIRFVGDLEFVEALRTLIPLDGFSDPPAVAVSAEGVKADYSIALPNIAFGVFSLQNISLGAGFTVPFIGKPLSVRFNFCQRESPFLLTVSAIGGGGYLMIAVDPKGVQSLEAGFEFGASLAIDFGVASGEIYVMGGFIYAMTDGKAALTGYLRMGGEVEALGIVTVSIELSLELQYQSDTGKCAGRATLTLEIEVAFFSTSVSLVCERKFAGSNGDPTFRQVMEPDGTFKPWDEYCEAFA